MNSRTRIILILKLQPFSSRKSFQPTPGSTQIESESTRLLIRPSSSIPQGVGGQIDELMLQRIWFTNKSFSKSEDYLLRRNGKTKLQNQVRRPAQLYWSPQSCAEKINCGLQQSPPPRTVVNFRLVHQEGLRESLNAIKSGDLVESDEALA